MKIPAAILIIANGMQIAILLMLQNIQHGFIPTESIVLWNNIHTLGLDLYKIAISIIA